MGAEAPLRWLAEEAASRRWCDVTLQADGRQYRAHRLVLSGASSFIRGLLLSCPSDATTTIVLADFPAAAVEALLQYVYSGEVRVPAQRVADFLLLAAALRVHIDVPSVLASANLSPINISATATGWKKDPNDKCLSENSVKAESGTNSIDLDDMIKSDRISKNANFLRNSNKYFNGKSEGSLLKHCFLKTILDSDQYLSENKINSCDVLRNNIQDRKTNIRRVSNGVVMSQVPKDVTVEDDSSCEIVSPVLEYNNGILDPRKSSFSNKSYANEPVKVDNDPNATILNLSCANIEKDAKFHNSVETIDRHMMRNHKLVRPIPSLMPIDAYASTFNAEQVNRIIMKPPPSLLDLTQMKTAFLKHNSNSAFKQVNNNPAHLGNPFPYKHAENIIENDALRDHLKYLQNQKSLRLRFSLCESNKYKSDEGSSSRSPENVFHNGGDTGPSTTGVAHGGDSRSLKRIPGNKAMASPWSAKGPVFYRQDQRRPKEQIRYSANEQKQSSSLAATAIETVIQLESQQIITANKTTKENDRNNNFSDSEPILRLKELTNEPIQVNAINDNISSDAKISDIHLKTILNGKRNTTKKPPEKTANEKIPKEVDKPSVAVRLEPPAVFVPGSVASGAYVCATCSKVFTSPSALAQHEVQHATRPRYRCETCDKCFSQLRNYKYHVSVHKGTKEFAATCNVCGKYFNDRGYLSSHMKIHRNRKEYQCPHCPKSFNQRVAYNMHVRIHTGVKPHQCEACGKAFSRKMLLKQHARTHSGEKPYACSACGKRFADRSNMTLHMRLHSGVKPFSCTLCPKSFTKKHHLKTHLNYHTGDKPYACVKCGLTFSQSSNMRTHMKKCPAPDPTLSLAAPSTPSDTAA